MSGAQFEVFFQVEGRDIGAQIAGDAPDLHVVGQHDDDLVTGLNIAPGKGEIRLGRSVGHKNVVQVSANVVLADGFSQLNGPVGLTVAQPQVEHGIYFLLAEKLFWREGVDAAFGQVVLNGVLIEGLDSFQVKDLKFHSQSP